MSKYIAHLLLLLSLLWLITNPDFEALIHTITYGVVIIELRQSK